MARIRIKGEGGDLLDTLLEEGFFVDNPCNGKGICGKCKVKVRGSLKRPGGSYQELSEISRTERAHLSEEEIASDIRLACMVQVLGDVEVELLKKEGTHKILDQGYLPEFQQDEGEAGYGVAVDIGTTTVAAALVDLSSGREVAGASMINAQKRFGLDVLTRITYEYEHPKTGIQELQKAMVGSLNGMIREMCGEAGISPEEIRRIHVSANCTMTHMLLGVDARSIGRAPYQPVFREAKTLAAAEIGLQAGKDTTLYCLPQVSAYIGADIVAGAYVCQLARARGNVLFVDIGTNGEIVLASGGRLLCCSCAAGPALEGMNISCGMRAAEGAVEDVAVTEEGVKLTTIGEEEPAGICGSGILAVLRELLRTGLVKKSGVFVKTESIPEGDYRHGLLRTNGKKREFILCKEPQLVVTQSDIRQVQLAKGAILSGFTALLRQAGVGMEDLDQVLVAGQFGAHLPVESLVGAGILPREVEEKVVYVGNASKNGAYMTLLSRKAREEVEALAEKMEYLELAQTDGYERIFAECMIFPKREE